MSAHACTEDQLVEQPAIGLLAELGWTTVPALEETFGTTGTLLRETKGEVVLVSRLRAAFDENLMHYKAEIPQLFWFNSFSNSSAPKTGSWPNGRGSIHPRRR